MYKKDRTNLNKNERQHFNLPIHQRMKRGLDNIEAWLTLVEQIYLTHEQDAQPKITQWLDMKKEDNTMDYVETKDKKEHGKNQHKYPGT